MKRMSIYRILAVLITATIFYTACTKESSDVRLDPTLATSQVLGVSADSATVVGFVVAEGAGFTERGVCYNTATAPTISNTKVVYGGKTDKATFTVKIGGLSYTTKYYVRAYATSATTTIYGDEYSFTTIAAVPTLTTTAVTAITGNSAASGGNVTDFGGADVTAKGVCFSTNQNPTVSDSKTSDGTGVGVYTSAVTSLKGKTQYYLRAYATNSAGTGYGPQLTFTTLVDLPAITTAAVTGITKHEAISGGESTYDGGSPITDKGLAWGLSANPTISGNVISAGAETGAFVSNLTGLTTFTTYHVRAYATNSAGTAYGADVQFTTLADTRTWYIPGDYVAASYPGTSFANWDPANSPQVKSTVTSPDKLEGYVYMANSSNQWKFASQPNWNGPNYGDDNNSGVLNPNAANNITKPAGYYKLNADAAALTYTAVATVWGVIGDATPMGWNDETALAYEPATRTWTGGMSLTAASFKFRANHSWDYNYGSTAANNTLDAGGSNISCTLASDYFFVLDLSNPNAYTYSANRWGVIGDATPDGWNSDQNMSWDPTNKAMTITLNLTAGTFKFRANDGWDLNLGGDPASLTQGGNNIPIATAGNYTIKLFLTGGSASHCTITQN